MKYVNIYLIHPLFGVIYIYQNMNIDFISKLIKKILLEPKSFTELSNSLMIFVQSMMEENLKSHTKKVMLHLLRFYWFRYNLDNDIISTRSDHKFYYISFLRKSHHLFFRAMWFPRCTAKSSSSIASFYGNNIVQIPWIEKKKLK